MSNQSRPRVAVIGGGAIGVSSAYHLALRGAMVWLITEGALASGASGRSLSWINAAGPYSRHYHRFRMLGIDRYRTLLAQHPGLDWLRFDGGLMWQPPENADILRELHDHQVARGYDSQLMNADQVGARIPGVNAAAIPSAGAIFNPGEGWVDLPSMINYLASRLVELGSKLIINAGKSSVITNGKRVTEISTVQSGTIAVDAALLATGSTVPQLAAEFGVTIPDATSRAFDAFRGFYRLEALKRELAPVLARVDLLCVPTFPTFVTLDEIAADPIGPNARLGTYTNFVNLLGLCGLAVPTPARDDGRPGSVTLLAAAGATR